MLDFIFKEVRCPDCKSCFVAEIHVIPKSLEKTNILMDKLSPASIVEELPTSIVPLNVEDVASIEVADDTNSIGMSQIGRVNTFIHCNLILSMHLF